MRRRSNQKPQRLSQGQRTGRPLKPVKLTLLAWTRSSRRKRPQSEPPCISSRPPRASVSFCLSQLPYLLHLQASEHRQ